ncbi:MAG: class I SAM-dependent methyltransferase, partial [Dysgonamonadaceae bacterium]|jgi:ubiquinone/menaquinone biosynthesis C-methylase UbiE|nr:class I SAM-dependent methyltransferase [Dysgonamonadaceae bacterium]MDD3728335.1 class I SAM-dependent methyltransferase [Dysgonamonadaceae bacterium]
MKVRDSGMPDEKMWSSFFDINTILKELLINSQVEYLVEIGCGYGTFTIPAAKLVSGKLYAFDIEPEMIEYVRSKKLNEKIDNIILKERDVLKHTTGLDDNSVDYVMIFNILHHESPQDFFDECRRILKPKGRIGIIHWRSDVPTPRGPDLSIRPRPEQIIEWMYHANFQVDKEPFILEPYHYGLVLSKK